MLSMAIGVLWFCIGLVILCGVIFLVIWIIEQFIMAIPEQIKKGIWVIVLLLALIALLTILAGGGLGSVRSPFTDSQIEPLPPYPPAPPPICVGCGN